MVGALAVQTKHLPAVLPSKWAPILVLAAALLIQVPAYGLGEQWRMLKSLSPSTLWQIWWKLLAPGSWVRTSLAPDILAIRGMNQWI